MFIAPPTAGVAYSMSNRAALNPAVRTISVNAAEPAKNSTTVNSCVGHQLDIEPREPCYPLSHPTSFASKSCGVQATSNARIKSTLRRRGWFDSGWYWHTAVPYWRLESVEFCREPTDPIQAHTVKVRAYTMWYVHEAPFAAQDLDSTR